MATLEYKGYTGLPRLEFEDGVIAGTILGIRSVVTFEGRTVEEAAQAFRDSVDDYLASCEEEGVEPEKPYSGRFVLRVSQDLHRKMAILAAERGLSLNSLVAETLEGVFGGKGEQGDFAAAEAEQVRPKERLPEVSNMPPVAHPEPRPKLKQKRSG